MDDMQDMDRPRTVKELGEHALRFDWDPRIGFKYWARAAETIHQEVPLSSAFSRFPLPTPSLESLSI